jgi:hypothetical protein
MKRSYVGRVIYGYERRLGRLSMAWSNSVRPQHIGDLNKLYYCYRNTIQFANKNVKIWISKLFPINCSGLLDSILENLMISLN